MMKSIIAKIFPQLVSQAVKSTSLSGMAVLGGADVAKVAGGPQVRNTV
jgi:hypothetical protein